MATSGADHWSDPTWERAHLAVENLDTQELTRLLETEGSLDLNVSGYQGWTLLAYAIDTEVIVQ